MAKITYDGLSPNILVFQGNTILHKRGCESSSGGFVEAETKSPADIHFKCRLCGATWTMEEIKDYLISKGVFAASP